MPHAYVCVLSPSDVVRANDPTFLARESPQSNIGAAKNLED